MATAPLRAGRPLLLGRARAAIPTTGPATAAALLRGASSSSSSPSTADAPSPLRDGRRRSRHRDAPWTGAGDEDGSSLPVFKNFVDGRFASVGGRRLPPNAPVVSDPSAGEPLAIVRDSAASCGGVDDAVAAARDAFPAWRDTPVQVRQRLLLDYAHVLRRREVREELAQ